MNSHSDRRQNEILQGRHLVAHGDPEHIWLWDTPAGIVRAQRRADMLSAAAGLRPGMRVLEVGCGTGLFTEMMAVHGAYILALDISPDLLAIARNRNLPSAQVEFLETSLEDYQADQPFDAIVGSSVLHHLDMAQALQRIYRLLTPGAVIAFAEPNMLNPQVWAERNISVIRNRMHVSRDETAIVRWKLSRDLRRVGFIDVLIKNTDWLHPGTPEFLISSVYNLGLIMERIPIIREFSGSVLIRARRPDTGQSKKSSI